MAVLAAVRVTGAAVATLGDVRLEDRRDLVAAFADVVAADLDRIEAVTGTLAAAVTGRGDPELAPELAAAPTTALVLGDDGRIVAASPPAAHLVGRTTEACPPPPPDPSGGSRPLLTLGRAPGTCGAAVLATTRAAPWTVVVVGSVEPLVRSLAAAPRIGAATRALVVDPTGAALEDGALTGAPREAAPATGPPTVRRRRSGDLEIVEAVAPAGHGWAVVIRQPAATFDPPAVRGPVVVVGLVVALAGGGATALLWWGERRRARTLAEARAAEHAFFGVVGHELRTPLTALRGFADLLAHRWEGLDDERRRRMIESVRPQIHRLGRTVERVLLAANLATDTHRPLVPEVLDVAGVVHPVVDLQGNLAPLHRVGTDVPAGLTVVADGPALAEVIDQLVDNAVRFTPAGSTVVVGAGLRRRRWAPWRREVEITVDDDGPGPPEDTAVLFEPFRQGEAVATRVFAEGGTGVGLYIARELVTRMGGELWMGPRPGGGTRVVVRLPVPRRPPPPQPAGDAGSGPEAAGVPPEDHHRPGHGK